MNTITLVFIVCILFTPGIARSQWFTQQSGTTNALYDIEFINDKTGWCCGDGGYIIKTTNGGTDWIQQSNGVPFEPLFGIHPVNLNIVYAVGFFRTFIKTTNGGQNWSSQDSGMQGDGTYHSVFFLNALTGWAGFGDGTFFGVLKTTNGGIDFTSHPAGTLSDIFFKDSINGIGVNKSPYVFKSINGGTNWSVQLLAGSGSFYRVSFIDEYTGYTSSTRAVYKTTNFGISWDSVGRVTPLDIDVTSIEFSNENTGWAGTSSQINKSTDGGRNWFVQVMTGVVYNIHSINDTTVWTCGNGGRIWHTLNGGMSSINNSSSFTISENFELYQNYPNPFNSSTLIKLDIARSGFYRMEIFNTSGKIVKEIFNQNFRQGTFDVIIDGNELGSGIYFYKLSGSEFSHTKKFVLIK